jgi:hypothetical protein
MVFAEFLGGPDTQQRRATRGDTIVPSPLYPSLAARSWCSDEARHLTRASGIRPVVSESKSSEDVSPMTTKTVHEGVLDGILRAIEAHAPELMPTMREVYESGCVYPATDGSGSRFEADVSQVNAEQVLEALVKIEDTEGPDVTFEGWRIGFLKLCWRRFTALW